MNDTPTIPAEHFMATIAANINNWSLSDEAFRDFIRTTLPIVIYPRKQDHDARQDPVTS